MNKVQLVGRFVRNPEITYTAGGDNSIAIAKFTLACDRRYKREGDEQTADFIRCIAFGKTAEFIERYFIQGMRIGITGRIQTGSFTNKDGNKVYTTDVVAEEAEFVERKTDSIDKPQTTTDTGFVDVPADAPDEGLPFD